MTSGKDAKHMFDYSKIDLELLKAQKESLLEVMNDIDSGDISENETACRHLEHLSGILHLLDYLQDCAEGIRFGKADTDTDPDTNGELTEQQIKEYAAAGGVKCPFCGSDQIGGGFVNIEAGQAWQRVSCLKCEKPWNDIYQLQTVEIED
jgi:hypothetical protein